MASTRCAMARPRRRLFSACDAACPHGRGLGLVSEDRKGEGLAQELSIADNLTLSRLQPYTRWGWVSLRRREEAVGHWMKQLEVKATGAATRQGTVRRKSTEGRDRPGTAPGGGRVSLGRAERGIDVGTKAEIYRHMGELAASGKSVIFVSSYLPELLAVCDRVGVMSRGRFAKYVPPAPGTRKRSWPVRSEGMTRE